MEFSVGVTDLKILVNICLIVSTLNLAHSEGFSRGSATALCSVTFRFEGFVSSGAGNYQPVKDRYPISCKEIQTYDPGAGDGEYWLNVSQMPGTGNETEHVIAKIYCHNMESDPVEYLSLLGDNNAKISSACSAADCSMYMYGNTVFTKVKIEFPLKAVAAAEFSSTAGNMVTPVAYGVGGDCWAEHFVASVNNAYGRFAVDLRNTGYAISSLTSWVATGYGGGADVTTDVTGQVISGICGGHCGGCAPTPAVYLNIYAPDYDAALIANVITKLIREGNFWHLLSDGYYHARQSVSADNHDHQK